MMIMSICECGVFMGRLRRRNTNRFADLSDDEGEVNSEDSESSEDSEDLGHS